MLLLASEIVRLQCAERPAVGKDLIDIARYYHVQIDVELLADDLRIVFEEGDLSPPSRPALLQRHRDYAFMQSSAIVGEAKELELPSRIASNTSVELVDVVGSIPLSPLDC